MWAQGAAITVTQSPMTQSQPGPQSYGLEHVPKHPGRGVVVVVVVVVVRQIPPTQASPASQHVTPQQYENGEQQSLPHTLPGSQHIPLKQIFPGEQHVSTHHVNTSPSLQRGISQSSLSVQQLMSQDWFLGRKIGAQSPGAPALSRQQSAWHADSLGYPPGPDIIPAIFTQPSPL